MAAPVITPEPAAAMRARALAVAAIVVVAVAAYANSFAVPFLFDDWVTPVASPALIALLEAFAAGIPVVSTRVGAEGLALEDGDVCALADDPVDFAAHVVELLRDGGKARALAERARASVVATRDMRAITARLERSYRAALLGKRT